MAYLRGCELSTPIGGQPLLARHLGGSEGLTFAPSSVDYPSLAHLKSTLTDDETVSGVVGIDTHQLHITTNM